MLEDESDLQVYLRSATMIAMSRIGISNVINSRYIAGVGKIATSNNNPLFSHIQPKLSKNKNSVAWNQTLKVVLAFLKRYKMTETIGIIRYEDRDYPKETGFTHSKELENYFHMLLTSNSNSNSQMRIPQEKEKRESFQIVENNFNKHIAKKTIKRTKKTPTISNNDTSSLPGEKNDSKIPSPDKESVQYVQNDAVDILELSPQRKDNKANPIVAKIENKSTVNHNTTKDEKPLDSVRIKPIPIVPQIEKSSIAKPKTPNDGKPHDNLKPIPIVPQIEKSSITKPKTPNDEKPRDIAKPKREEVIETTPMPRKITKTSSSKKLDPPSKEQLRMFTKDEEIGKKFRMPSDERMEKYSTLDSFTNSDAQLSPGNAETYGLINKLQLFIDDFDEQKDYPQTMDGDVMMSLFRYSNKNSYKTMEGISPKTNRPEKRYKDGTIVRRRKDDPLARIARNICENPQRSSSASRSDHQNNRSDDGTEHHRHHHRRSVDPGSRRY